MSICSKVLLLPITCEGCARSVIKAWVSRLPIVTPANSGRVVDRVVEGCIYLYEHVDVASIKKLVGNSALRESIVLVSRKRIEEFDHAWVTETPKRGLKDS